MKVVFYCLENQCVVNYLLDFIPLLEQELNKSKLGSVK